MNETELSVYNTIKNRLCKRTVNDFKCVWSFVQKWSVKICS